jgi:hypothetical protein
VWRGGGGSAGLHNGFGIPVALVSADGIKRRAFDWLAAIATMPIADAIELVAQWATKEIVLNGTGRDFAFSCCTKLIN